MLSIFNYQEPISFINDYINLRRKQDNDFSIRKWSKQLGMSSKAPLLDLLSGKKKLRGKLLDTIIDHLPIDDDELMYFQAINERSQIQDEKRKLMYDLLIHDLRPSNREGYKCDRNLNANIFSHWIYMVILSMANLENFEMSIINIKNKLIENFEEEFVQRVLSELTALGLLQEDNNGHLKRTSHSYTTTTNSDPRSTGQYYKLVSDLAKRSIELASDERELQCFSFALSKKKLPLAKEIIRKTRTQLALLGEEDNEKDTVYQANLMVFPLTK